MLPHHGSRAADESDPPASAGLERVKRIKHDLLEIGLYGVEQVRRGIDVDEHAVGQSLVEFTQLVGREHRRAHRNEAGIVAAVRDEVVDVVVDRRVHALLLGLGGQHVAQFVEIRILQTLVGDDVVQDRDVARNDDALVLRGVLVPEFEAGVQHLLPGGFLDGERGIVVEDPRHGGLREPRVLRDLLNRGHRRLASQTVTPNRVYYAK